MFTNTKTNGEPLHNLESVFSIFSSFSYSGYDACAFTAAGMSPPKKSSGRDISNDNKVHLETV